ncbi:MAG: tRNA (N6-isopentenyl adenosine(37)-C2)-methylthiotransferase MiaB [bacterium]
MKSNTKKNLSQGTNNRYHIITHGCQMNVSDSEKIVGLLERQGYQKAKDAKSANLVVINVCSVRQSAMDRVYSKIKELRISARGVRQRSIRLWRRSAFGGKNLKLFPEQSRRVRIILAGCLLETDKKKLKDKVDEIWYPDKYFSMASCRENKNLAYVPIMTGCNNFCAYCVVPYTRGREKSRSALEIIKEVKRLIKSGYKEIVLIGQNVNSYSCNMEHETCNTINFPKLLKIINDLPGDFWLRFMTSHPKDMSDELIEAVAKCGKVKKEIHLPIQSGDDEILKKMNRGYTVKKYKNLIKKIRQKIPGVKISTDVIVGFPGETKKQFQNTAKLFRQIKFNKAYIAKYSPRHGTAAAKLKDDVSPQEKKRRWQILEKIANQKK